MTRAIRIGDVELPIEAVTETFAVLGKRGAGKTTTARVLAEGLLDAQLPVVAIDPMGVWWGLRSSADGKAVGHEVVIFGGEHADVPLEPASGALIADVIIEHRIPAVLDLFLMTKTQARTFVTAFVSRLYHKNREPLHVIVDEADMFAPQRVYHGGEQMLGAMEDLVRRGRVKGLGVSLLSQRPQALHKDVLSQAEVLICHRMVGVRDVAAIDEWVRLHAEEAEARQVKADLPTLPVGVAWLWSPGWLGRLVKVHVQRPSTYDSSQTPKPGERRPRIPRLHELDLGALGEQIAAMAEKAKADDPRALRQRIAQLERELAKKAAGPVTMEVQVERIPEHVLADVREALETLAKVRDTHSRIRADLMAQVDEMAAAAEEIARTIASSPEPTRRPQAVRKPVDARPPADPSNNGLRAWPTPARQRILNSLAELESIGVPAAPKTQLALWAGASPKSSGYTNNLGALRTAGLLHYPSPGVVQLTAEGRQAADSTLATPTLDGLHDRVRELLPPSRWRIIEALIDTYPEPIEKPILAERVGVSASSSGYTNNLGALRSLGLIEYPEPRMVAAAPILFLGGS